MKKQTLKNQANKVHLYLYNLGLMIADIRKQVKDKKDNKWLKDNILAILQVMDFIDFMIAIDKVKGYIKNERTSVTSKK
jgi:hypothetical protein